MKETSDLKKSDKEKTSYKKPETSQEKLKMLGALISGITHEINTPMHYLGTNLTFLKFGFADLLKLHNSYQALLNKVKAGKILSEADWENLEKIEQEADPEYLKSETALALEQSIEGIEMVSRLVLALKDFSHSPTHNFALVDVNKCVDTACTISRHEWKRVADLNLDLARDLPYLFASRDELHQVLLNLLVNAAHAVADKVAAGEYDRGKISVITRSQGDSIVIEVKNDGPLISEKHLPQIFEPYFTTKDAGKGSGLGLNLVKRIVEQEHGGKISVSSSQNSGTSFILTLPHRQNSLEL